MLARRRPPQVMEAYLRRTAFGVAVKTDLGADPFLVGVTQGELERDIRLAPRHGGPPIVLGAKPQLVFSAQSGACLLTGQSTNDPARPACSRRERPGWR